ncbi:MAG: DeoR family transcriptional regulator [Anaerolineales bacterium]|nr:DeoR family transcriptional regulator [Anaerolineales bacterium]
MVKSNHIFDLLLKHGELSVEELVQQLGVSQSTIRRHIKSMDGTRHVQKTRTGIRLASSVNYDVIPTYKWPVDPAEARAIANHAAQMIQRGDVIAISGGLICTQLAIRLRSFEGITVVTNAINIATELTAVQGVQVKLTGGVLNKNSYELVGPSVNEGLTDVYINKFFLGTNGLSNEHGVTNFDEAEALAASTIMGYSKSTILLADSSKFGKPNFAKVCSISDIDVIVTTEKAPQQILDKLRDAGVNVELAHNP